MLSKIFYSYNNYFKSLVDKNNIYMIDCQYNIFYTSNILKLSIFFQLKF